MLPNIDYSELPRALQHMLERDQTATRTLPRRSFLKLAGATGLALGAFPHIAMGAGSRWRQGRQRPQADAAAFSLRPDRRQWRGHGDDQPAGIRPGRAHRLADDPGGGTRRRLEPGAQPARHQRCRLCRPAVRHPSHRRLPFDQEQLCAVSRARRTRTGHAARRRRGALESRRGHAAHAGRYGAWSRRPQARLRRIGRGRHGAAGA